MRIIQARQPKSNIFSYDNVFFLNPNQMGDETAPVVYFALWLFSNSFEFYEIWWLFLKFNWDSSSGKYVRNSNCFLQCQYLFMIRCYFFCISSVGIINISMTILFVFQFRRFRKTFIDFCNNTFPIETGIINLFHYIWGTWFIHKNA